MVIVDNIDVCTLHGCILSYVSYVSIERLKNIWHKILNPLSNSEFKQCFVNYKSAPFGPFRVFRSALMAAVVGERREKVVGK